MKLYKLKIHKGVYNIVVRGLSPSLCSNLASIVNTFLIPRWKSDQSGEVSHCIEGVNDCSLKALFGPNIIEVAFSTVRWDGGICNPGPGCSSRNWMSCTKSECTIDWTSIDRASEVIVIFPLAAQYAKEC